MAAASSAHTRPSHSARMEPSSHPSMHCGPPIALIISGMVMKGPTPTMLHMLRAVACNCPKLRSRCCGSCEFTYKSEYNLSQYWRNENDEKRLLDHRDDSRFRGRGA